MKTNVKINISARHVHLTEEAIKVLFADGLHEKNKLNQVGQFACLETVSIKTEEGMMEHVRVIGPARKYNQVEISKTDARKLKIEPPVRKSGHLDGASPITIFTERGSISGNFAIIADRHVHFSPEDAKHFEVVDDQDLILDIPGIKKGSIYVKAKVSDDGFFEVHLDTDDANAFLINAGDSGVLRSVEDR